MSVGFLAHVVALIAALEIVVLTSLAWAATLRAGPPLGLDGGAILLFMPLGLLILFGMWLVVRFLLVRRFRWTILAVLAVTLVLGYLIVAASCGPVACFTATPNRHMGWFLVLGIALAAAAHHLALTSFRKKNNGH
ncbi:MAG: hypothetical protein IT535_01380 [Bauldia sp.]|nr:hypothetical protein [Bauldia sp.]